MMGAVRTLADRVVALVGRAGSLLGQPTGVYAAIAALLVALFTVTTMIVGRFEHARAERAESLFAEGRRAVEADRVNDGIVSLRAALALNRRNPEYGLALASALLDAGRSREATSYLDAVLAERPTGGPANLVRARAARMLGDVDEAVLYYRRSADGTWPPGSREERAAVRFEVAEYLIGRGRLADAGVVLSELRVSAPGDVQTRLKLARLLLMAKLPGDAAAELRTVNASAPGPDVWGVLAQAEFALGNDSSARSWGQRVLKVRPGDEAIATLVDVASGALSLDPTLPRLRNTERIRRARQLLVQVVQASSACAIGRELTPEPFMQSRDRAREFLSQRAAADADPVVDAIQLSEALWAATTAACPATPGGYPVLDRLLTRLLAARADGS